TITLVGAGNCTVTASQAGNATYSAAPDVSQLFVVNKATPVITWVNPPDITYGTPLGATELNAKASVMGSFAFAPAAGTVLKAGNGESLSVLFTPQDGTDYIPVTKTVSINVLPAPQT